MAKRKRAKTKQREVPVVDYRYNKSTRKNIPPAGLAAQGKVREHPKITYAYNPHLPPVLRFDSTGGSDKLPALLETARQRVLTTEEAKLLSMALRNNEPWLEWAGKQEKKWFEVDPVALHIHERVSAQAILKIAARQDVQRDLFADPKLEYQKAVQFYQHDMDWTNRLILGDSLQVMASLARRENLAGHVQMIYMDPPYGIRFASNFQPEIGKRDVKDKESDLTREPEMVKAYRDTWTLGVHSYLSYLRDRFWLCKELLRDSGSVFVQISDENVHRVRSAMDEVFGPSNFVSLITVKKTGGMGEQLMDNIADYILWYAKDKDQIQFFPLYDTKVSGEGPGERYQRVELPDGSIRPIKDEEIENPDTLPAGARPFLGGPLTSQTPSESTLFSFPLEGRELRPRKGGWKTNSQGMRRLINAHRLISTREFVNYKMYLDDFPAVAIGNLWTDTMGTAEQNKVYVVQTTTKVIARCILMTTKPGDLVLDPTCGSGTSAYVSEMWGRRWITIDTSRVSTAIARQRILTSTYSHYKVKNGNGNGELESANPGSGFCYRTVPHIMLKSIAQNVGLDSIFAKHQPGLDEKLKEVNNALKFVTPQLKQRLALKLREKEKQEGKKSIADADRRRWILPKEDWKEWEVPFDIDQDWPGELQSALLAYHKAWRAKMDEVNICIAANAEPAELVDQPEEVKGVVRVAGPFTVEAVMPAEETLDSPIGGEPEDLETFSESGNSKVIPEHEPANAEAYLDKMLRLIRTDGVRFPNNKVLNFTRLEPFQGEYIHAEGEWETDDGKTRKVAVSFGPQFGPVTAYQVEQVLPTAHRRGFDDVIFAGFSFDGAAQAIIQEDPNPKVHCHLAHIRPDVNMGDLLKETSSSQLFTVFGSPRTKLLGPNEEGEYTIEMEGVDVYNPVDNTILPTNADKVAAWFLDTDYDGRTFCITQAFFPDKSAWDKISRALKGVIDEDRFEALSGTVSLPFVPGKHKRVAVKVIDPRGNEVMRVHKFSKSSY
ncbi:MAG: site-specific DNA-methyltransferase [Bacteroidota bacterium]|jgi:adenine-specific DNA-methyltransferase